MSQKLTRKAVRSPLFYVGDKYKLVSQLLKCFPDDITRFIEPFTGGGSVPMNIEAQSYYLNDIDSNIVAIHKMLESNADKSAEFFEKVLQFSKKYNLSRSFLEDVVPEALREKHKKTYYAKHNNEGYLLLRDEYNKSDKKDAFILYLLLIYGFNRMIRFNGQGKFNVPVGNVDFNLNVKESLQQYFEWTNKHEIKWANKDCIEFLKDFEYKPGDFIYLDPPYLITFSEYNKIWNENNENELLDMLDKLNKMNVKFAISNVTYYKGRQNDIFIEWSKKYRTCNIKSNYISYHDNSIKKFKEVLVTNYVKK